MTNFLKDDNNNHSVMRLVTLILVIAGVAWGTFEILYRVFGNNDYVINTEFIIGTISVGVSGKGVQKLIELFKK